MGVMGSRFQNVIYFPKNNVNINVNQPWNQHLITGLDLTLSSSSKMFVIVLPSVVLVAACQLSHSCFRASLSYLPLTRWHKLNTRKTASSETKQPILFLSMSAFFGEPYYSNNLFGYVSPYQYERQRIMEESRRRRAELQYRRQLEERERRRQAAIMDYQRRLARENALRRQHQRYHHDEEDQEADQYYIVRGSDGCLYRVPARNIVHNKHRYRNQELDEPTLERELHEPEEEDELQAHSSSEDLADNDMKTEETIPSMEAEREVSGEIYEADDISCEGSATASLAAADVVVEDASDDEEEKELKSIWRNRRPSPGALMEPVEAL